MNANDFENLLMELTQNSYYDFRKSVESIDLDVLTKDQEIILLTLCETKKNDNEEDAVVRKAAMEIILGMSDQEFFESLELNSLPPFIRACEYDTDYVHIFRDSNHPQGLQRAFIHREQLSQTERDIFIANHVLTIEEAMDFDLRQKSMEIIRDMTEEEFKEALINNTLPTFVRAKVRDPDYIHLYRDISAEHGFNYAYWNRMRLRTIEIDHFKNIHGIISCWSVVSSSVVSWS